MLGGLDHVTIAVHDVELSARTYTALLGRPPVWRGEHVGLGTDAALFALENTLVELVGPRAGAEESEGLRAWLQTHGEGLLALAFATDDAAAFSAALRGRGLRVTRPEQGVARAADGSERSYRSVELAASATRGLSVLVVERPDTTTLRGGTHAPDDCVYALDHVVIRTASPQAALALYGEQLGVRLALDRELAGTRMLFFRIGGVTLEVVHDRSRGERDTLWGLAYRVRDIAAAHARLAGAGVAVSEVRDGRKPGTQVCTISGPTCGVPTLVLRDTSRS